MWYVLIMQWLFAWIWKTCYIIDQFEYHVMILIVLWYPLPGQFIIDNILGYMRDDINNVLSIYYGFKYMRRISILVIC